MKTIKRTIQTLLIGTSLLISNLSNAQSTTKETCTILNIEVNGAGMVSSKLAGNLTRHTMKKIKQYEISYDQDINQEEVKYDCYSKKCLLAVGKKLESDKMLSGYIERTKGNIIVSFREMDVKTGKITNSISNEFKEIPEQLKNMILLSLQQMYGKKTNPQLEEYLINEYSRESFENNRGSKRLNLSGVRMGMVQVLGENVDKLKAPEEEGGFDASATMFQFGYQFETIYLNKGRVQGLFEFIPTITGLEQGLFLPSLTVLHGLRDNKTGIEFAFGPTFGFTSEAKGYFENGEWHLEKDWTDELIDNPNDIVTRLDSRGSTKLTAGFVFGAGFSLKRGDLNIPINLFTVMQKKSFRVGISFGFNAKGI